MSISIPICHFLRGNQENEEIPALLENRGQRCVSKNIGLYLQGYSLIDMCGPKGHGCLAVLVINRLSILVLYRVWFLHSGLQDSVCFILEATFSSPYNMVFVIDKSPSQ